MMSFENEPRISTATAIAIPRMENVARTGLRSRCLRTIRAGWERRSCMPARSARVGRKCAGGSGAHGLRGWQPHCTADCPATPSTPAEKLTPAARNTTSGSIWKSRGEAEEVRVHLCHAVSKHGPCEGAQDRARGHNEHGKLREVESHFRAPIAKSFEHRYLLALGADEPAKHYV
jgi:hypothetical protein